VVEEELTEEAAEDVENLLESYFAQVGLLQLRGWGPKGWG